MTQVNALEEKIHKIIIKDKQLMSWFKHIHTRKVGQEKKGKKNKNLHGLNDAQLD